MFDNQALVVEVPRLRKFALKLTQNAADADDLVQSAVLRAMEKKELFQSGTDLFKWVSKIMYNLFVSAHRRKTKFESQYDPEDVIARQSVEGIQEHKAEMVKVSRLMSRLGEEHREVLIMVCARNMPYQEVAERLRIPVGTVRSRLSRARDQLKRMADVDQELPAPAARAAQSTGEALRRCA